jgi:hypothetical protein
MLLTVGHQLLWILGVSSVPLSDLTCHPVSSQQYFSGAHHCSGWHHPASITVLMMGEKVAELFEETTH